VAARERDMLSDVCQTHDAQLRVATERAEDAGRLQGEVAALEKQLAEARKELAVPAPCSPL
jgi:hypothetical protein